MSATPDQPEGLGTPSGGQPGFAPPAPGHTVSGPTVPSPMVDPPVVVAPPPSGGGTQHARLSRVRWVAALLAASLVLIGIFSALPLVPTVGPTQPQPSATPVAVDTVTPSAAPGSASTATRGGDLGRKVAFASGAGKGTVTVRSGVWTDTGEMAPGPGRRYLVLDVSITCTGGTLGVDALMFRATTSRNPELPGFGPALSDPLGGQVLTSGATARGQVGYALAPGAVTVQVLDTNLEPVAEIRIPAP
jgi:hypothetical protein